VKVLGKYMREYKKKYWGNVNLKKEVIQQLDELRDQLNLASRPEVIKFLLNFYLSNKGEESA